MNELTDRRESRKTLLLTILGAIILVGVVFLTTPVTEFNGGFDSDGRYYGAMAGEPSFPAEAKQVAPWCYRVLTPYLASLLPYGTLLDFRILGFISNVLSIIVLTLILEILGFTPLMRLFGALLYTGSFWTLKFSFYSPAYIDYQTQLFLLLIVWLTLRRTYAILPIVFLLAALQKESLAAFTLFSIAHMVRCGGDIPVRNRIFLGTAMLAAPFVAVFEVRHAITALEVSATSVSGQAAGWIFDPGRWPVFAQAAFSGLGIIPAVLLITYQPWVEFLRRQWEWIVYALISLAFLFGGVDKSRLFLYGLPLAAIFAVHTASFYRRYLSAESLAVWAAVIVIIHWYIGGYLSPMGPFAAYLAQMVPEYSGGRYVPYLVRNLILGIGVFVFTIQFVMREWHFRPKAGFTRRGKTPGTIRKTR